MSAPQEIAVTTQDSLSKAILFELLPLPIAVLFVAPWIAIGTGYVRFEPTIQIVFLVEALFFPVVCVAGFGWMGRGHKVIGGCVLLGRGFILVCALGSALVASSGNCRGCDNSHPVAMTLFVGLSACWFLIPLASASLLWHDGVDASGDA